MQKLKRSLTLLFVLGLVIAIVLPACSAKTAQANLQPEGSLQEGTGENLIINYQGQDITVTMEEILQLAEIEKDVTAVPKDDEEKETRKVKGVLLEDVFNAYLGISQKDVQAIRLVAGDGYAVEVSPDLLQTREIILAYEMDGKPLEEWEKPFRSVVPDVFEMYWVKNLTRIEVIESRQAAKVKRIIILETRISEIESIDYQYYEEAAKAVKISDLLFSFSEDDLLDIVNIKSVDGLEKNEKIDIFTKALIKHTGEYAPMFLSEDLPTGMWVKYMLYFVYGGSAYFSTASGFKTMDLTVIDNKGSIKLSDVFKTCGISQSAKYIFKALDGYTAEIEASSIDKGYIYIQDNGLTCVSFEGLTKNTKVKDLVYIGVSE